MSYHDHPVQPGNDLDPFNVKANREAEEAMADMRAKQDAHEMPKVADSKVGVKFDSGKPMPELLQLRALLEVAKVSEYGARKYSPNNWRKGMKWSRLVGAACRHLFAFWNGQNTDPESGLPHLAHCAWNILSLLEYYLCGYNEQDDRWNQDLMTDEPEVKYASKTNKN